MTTDALFCSLTPLRLAELVRSAQQAVCYAGPGIQLDLAQAMVEVAGRVGKEMLTVSLDFDDRVMRMGYGNVDAVKLLLDAGIAVQSSPGLRTALVVVDNEGYIFTPTALYLEAEPTDGAASNAVRMSGEQVSQALARLSPAAKTIAIAQAKTPEAKQHIEALTVDVANKHLQRHNSASALLIDRCAPAVAPVLGAVDVAPVPFCGASFLQGGGGLGGQPALFGGFFTGGDAVGCFFVQQLCHRGRAACAAQSPHDHGACDNTLAQGHGVATAQVAGRFGLLAIDGDTALADFIRGQAAGLVKPGAPQPFVQSHCCRCIHGEDCAVAAVLREPSVGGGSGR